MIGLSLHLWGDAHNEEASYACGIGLKLVSQKYQDSSCPVTVMCTGVGLIAPSIIWSCLRRWFLDLQCSCGQASITFMGVRLYASYSRSRWSS